MSYLHDIIHIKAVDVLKDNDAVTRWLTSPNMELGGKSPFQVVELEKEIGFEKVVTILNRIEHGIFS